MLTTRSKVWEEVPLNQHWDSFATDLAWFVSDRKRLAVGTLAPPGSWRPSREVARRFPTMANLLAAAHTSPVTIDDQDLILFSWECDDGVSCWLCPPPASAVPENLFPAHRSLLKEFGGITERTGEFDGSWLLNTNESLTLDEAQHDATFIRDYEWAFANLGGIPINMDEYYSISREANGNDTLCHRRTGGLLMFAPDHSFTHVVPLEGCPEYTLYRINGAATLVAWIEVVAQQWSDVIERL